MKKLALIIAALAMGLTLAIPVGAALALPILPNGFTAKIIATSDQHISGTIDATGYDLGIYIGPGVTGVRVTGATVENANDEGILVQDTSNIVILGSTVEGNAVNWDSADKLSEVKGIVLAGTTNVLVQGDVVKGNLHGGISILDDGPSIIFAPKSISSTPVASTGNVVKANLIADNPGDCGIVVSAKNPGPGGGVSNNVISENTVIGFNPAAGDLLPGVGGIVVAGGAFGPVNLSNNVVRNNTVSGGFLPGISLHAFGPGVITGTQLIGNELSNNGAGELSGNTTGIEIFALFVAPPGPGQVGVISGTQILNDSVSNDYYGVWHAFDTGANIVKLKTSGVTVAVFPP